MRLLVSILWIVFACGLSLRPLAAAVPSEVSDPQPKATLQGRVVDAQQNSPLMSAYVTVRFGKDSVTRLADSRGWFTVVGLPMGDVTLRVSFLGYRTYTKVVKLASSVTDVGVIELKENSKEIDAVTVEGKVQIMTQTGDTIKYNPLAFKNGPNDYAIDLIEKFPGITLDDDGSVTALGKSVSWAFVNGKLLFGRSVSNALENVKVTDIKSVKVYDVANPEKPLDPTHLREEDKQRVLDIETKTKFSSAYNVELYGGWGQDMNHSGSGTPRNRYLGGGNAMLFSEKIGLRADVVGNNIGRENFGYRRMFRGGSMGVIGPSGQSGYSRYNGASFSVDRSNPFVKRKGPNASFSYNFRNNYHSDGSINEKVYFPTEEFRSRIAGDTSSSVTESYTHTFSVMLGKVIDRRYFLMFRPSFEINDNRSVTNNASTIFLDDALLNRASTYNRNNDDKWSTSGTLAFNMSLRKRTESETSTRSGMVRPMPMGRSGGRMSMAIVHGGGPGRGMPIPIGMASDGDAADTTDKRPVLMPSFGIDGNWNYNHNRGDGWRVDTTATEGSRTVLSTTSGGYTKKFGANVRFADIPLSRGTGLSFNYSIDYDHSKTRRLAIDTLTNMIDSTVTYNYTRNYTTQNANASFVWYPRRTSVVLRVQMGVKSSWSNRDERFPEPLAERRTFLSPVPSLSIGSYYTESFSQRPMWQFSYSGSASEPSLEALRNWLDTEDPLSLSLGNPSLKQSYSHNVSFRYWKLNTEKSTEFSFNVSASYTSNDIATKRYFFTQDTLLAAYDYTAQAGATLSTYENTNGSISANTSVHYSRPLIRDKFILNGDLGFSFSRRPAYIRELRNFTRSSAPTLTLGLQSNHSRNWEYGISSSTSYTYSSNTAGGDNKTFVERLSANLRIRFLKTFEFNTTYQYYYYHSTDAADLNNNILNASLAYRFYKNRGEVRFAVSDILNRNKDFSSSVYSEYVQNTWRQLLSRYFTITVSFRFNKMSGGRR